jgi:hypothetical protein
MRDLSGSDGFVRDAEPAVFPLDERLEIEPYRQTTRRLERLVCEMGIRLPFAPVASRIVCK